MRPTAIPLTFIFWGNRSSGLVSPIGNGVPTEREHNQTFSTLGPVRYMFSIRGGVGVACTHMRGTWKMALSTPLPGPSSPSSPPKPSPTRLGADDTTEPDRSASLWPGPGVARGGEISWVHVSGFIQFIPTSHSISQDPFHWLTGVSSNDSH